MRGSATRVGELVTFERRSTMYRAWMTVGPLCAIASLKGSSKGKGVEHNMLLMRVSWFRRPIFLSLTTVLVVSLSACDGGPTAPAGGAPNLVVQLTDAPVPGWSKSTSPSRT